MRRTQFLGIGLALCAASIFASCARGDDLVAEPTGSSAGAGGGGGATSSSSSASTGGAGPICSPGAIVCTGTTAATCDAGGKLSMPTDCAAKGAKCVDGVGCAVCKPGEGSCMNGSATICRADGSGFDAFVCDPIQGMTCDPDGCKGPCSPATLGSSYIGCDYWPTVTLNPVWSVFDFAIAIANTSDAPATITIEQGKALVQSLTVDPKDVKLLVLPWVPNLKGPDQNGFAIPQDPGNSKIAKAGAYHVRSTEPVTVVQYNALEYTLSPPPMNCPPMPAPMGLACNSYSNDASLLLPTSSLTRDYATLTWPTQGSTTGFITVTATRDNTTVSVVGRDAFAAGAGVSAQGMGQVLLDAGDVLELIAAHNGINGVFQSDISGTMIHADQPVSVIAGHSCANIPTAKTGFCDHLEQTMPPIEALDRDYFLAAPASPAAPSPYVLRVAAVEATTTISFDPPIAPPKTISPGEAPFELDDVTADVHLTSDKPILVAQYMEGSTAVPSGKGDPSESIAVATPQFRSDYVFVAPHTYDASFVSIFAKLGTDVTLDGAVVKATELSPIGMSGWGVVKKQLTAPGDVHRATAASEFGLVVYGYGVDTSYMVPGGLDVKHLTIPPQH